MLWTDASSREFIAKEYPWFLDTFDDYTYPIQRADVIRYFVLHHYGGVYLDLDVGCLRSLDTLLTYPVILPKTIPVGVSNDLMFAEKGHPFMAQTIHNLVTFDHSWYLNYPTVMFSTGPMFLSAQYGIWTAAHPLLPDQPGGDVRVLPKALYGKNARPDEAPHAFFSHFYGSSWHSDDAAFVGFLGQWGKILMAVGAFVVLLGLVRLALPSARRRRRRVDVLLPRLTQHGGRWQLDFGWFVLPPGTVTSPPSPIALPSPVPSLDEEEMLSLSFDLRSRASSPAPSDKTDILPSSAAVMEHPAVSAAMRMGGRVLGSLLGRSTPSDAPRSSRSRRPRVFFMPPSYSSESEHELSTRRGPVSPPPRYTSPMMPVPSSDKEFASPAVEDSPSLLGSTSTGVSSRSITPVPPYEGALPAYFQSNPHGSGLGSSLSRAPHISRPSSRQS